MTGRRVAALVWDMDGTLLDSRVAVTGAFRQAALDLSGRRWSADEVVAAYPIGPPSQILGHLLGGTATVADEQVYLHELDGRLAEVVVHDGVREVLEEVARDGVAMAVFTGGGQAAAEAMLGAVGLSGHFATIVGGDVAGRPKPAPDGVLLACQRLGVAPVDAAYIGDSPLDLEAARRSGALAVAAGWGHLYDPGAPYDVLARAPGDVRALLAPAETGPTG